jgi:hypothetical protein
MSNNTRRSIATRAVAVAATAAAAFAGSALIAPSAGATVSTLVTITKLGAHRLPALTANQVITVTGTGFDEDVITSVEIDGCTTDPTYVVQNVTTLLVKTSDDCAKTSTGVLTLTDTAGGTVVTVPGTTGGAFALAFVDAPTIATPSVTVKPVVTENTQGAAYANQVTSVATKGGATIRVKAGAVAFINSTTYPLSATLGGVALTKVTLGASGAFFTGVVGAHAADAAPVLKVTNNGVTKSFTYATGTTAGTHSLKYAGTSIAVTPASGSLAGGALNIAGSGFTASTTATVGGVNCPVIGTPTATLFKCTAAAVTAAGTKDVVTTTGTVVSVISPTSSYTFLDQ